MSYLFTQADSETSKDAFGRQRTSELFTLLDYKHVYTLDTNMLAKVSNGGTVTYRANSAACRLATSNNSNSSAIQQSRMYHQYSPGKSQLYVASFILGANTTNVTKRLGYFDDKDGIFLEQDGSGVLSFNIRSSVTGSPVVNRITQSNWNYDKFDGTGASKINLDVTKVQLFWLDFQWMGAGVVRCGFIVDGVHYIAHKFKHSNQISNVYMSSPNLPVRNEIINTGTTTGGYFDQMCSSVMTEGGYVETGIDFGITSNTLVSVAGNATTPVLAIKLANTFNGNFNRVITRVNHVEVYSSAQPIKYSVRKLDSETSLSGGTWLYADANNSAVMYNQNPTSYSDGQEFGNGYIAASSQGNNIFSDRGAETGSNAKRNFIAQNIDCTDSQVYVIIATNLTGSSTTVGGGFSWREIY